MTGRSQWKRDCIDCPLLECEGLRPLDKAQLKFMQGFKQGEFTIDKGTQSLVQGSISPHVYTLLEGVLFRYRILEDGRRQIVNLRNTWSRSGAAPHRSGSSIWPFF